MDLRGNRTRSGERLALQPALRTPPRRAHAADAWPPAACEADHRANRLRGRHADGLRRRRASRSSGRADARGARGDQHPPLRDPLHAAQAADDLQHAHRGGLRRHSAGHRLDRGHRPTRPGRVAPRRAPLRLAAPPLPRARLDVPRGLRPRWPRDASRPRRRRRDHGAGDRPDDAAARPARAEHDGARAHGRLERGDLAHPRAPLHRGIGRLLPLAQRPERTPRLPREHLVPAARPPRDDARSRSDERARLPAGTRDGLRAIGGRRACDTGRDRSRRGHWPRARRDRRRGGRGRRRGP